MLSREEVERLLEAVRAKNPHNALDYEYMVAIQTAQSLYAERDELRETVTRLNRRCTTAEALADKSIEQLRDAGQRTFGRMLANYAAESALRKVEELEAVAEAGAAYRHLIRCDPEPERYIEVETLGVAFDAALAAWREG